MSDLIRREEVKDRVNSMLALFQVPKDLRKEALELFIDSIPSAEPKMGRWIDHSDEGYVQCPFCGSFTTCEDNIDELHYCFNCGAKMERSE